MAEVAHELELSRQTGGAAGGGERGGLASTVDVPDIVSDKRLLKLVPWAGDGEDPLSGSGEPGA